MTSHQKQKIKEKAWNVGTILACAALVIPLWVSHTSASNSRDIGISVLTEQMTELSKTVEEHINDNDKHMPFNQKVKMFVPRTEMEVYMENFIKMQTESRVDIKEMQKQLNAIYEKIK